MRRMRGFTLIELIVTIVIAGIAMMIALPNMTTMIVNNQSQAQGEDLVNLINLARSEAVKRGGRVVLCASSNGTSCGGAWTQGMIVAVDSAVFDGASAVSIATPATDVIKRLDPLDDDANLTATQGGGAADFIRFTSSGMVGRVNNNANPIVLTSSVTGCEGMNQRRIEVGISGMVSIERENCSGG